MEQKPLQIYNLTNDEINPELLDFIEQLGMSDISELLDNNSEKLNIEDAIIHFVDIDTEHSKWIIYHNPNPDIDRKTIENILLTFFGENWKQNFELKLCVWSEFKNNCIAYRAAKGTAYSIWEYNEK